MSADVGIQQRVARSLPAAGLWRGAIGVLVFLAILEALTRAQLVNPTYLPPASTILVSTGGLLFDPEFLAHIWATLRAWGIGLALGILVAVPAGMVLGSSNFAYRATHALVEFLRPIPSVALIPLAILLFGQGTEMKVSLVVYGSVWPILFNTVYGFHSVDPVMKDTARGFKVSRVGILWRVSLPSAAPFIYTGIRVASAIALILAISAELLSGGTSGLGTYIALVSQAGAQHLVYAGTVVAGLLGFLINWVLVRVEHRLLGWQPALRE